MRTFVKYVKAKIMKTITKPISKLSNIDYEYRSDENVVTAFKEGVFLARLNFFTDQFTFDESDPEVCDNNGNLYDQSFYNELYQQMTYYKENYYN